MHYQTRHLEALTEFSHGDEHLRKGDRFHATEVDAAYYIGKNRAAEVSKAPEPQAYERVPAGEVLADVPVDVPRRRGRPAKVQTFDYTGSESVPIGSAEPAAD